SPPFLRHILYHKAASRRVEQDNENDHQHQHHRRQQFGSSLLSQDLCPAFPVLKGFLGFPLQHIQNLPVAFAQILNQQGGKGFINRQSAASSHPFIGFRLRHPLFHLQISLGNFFV